MPRNLEAIVLAGGLGTRLRTVLPEGFPKILAPVGGRAFLDVLLDWLHAQGVAKVVFSLGYGAAHVLAHLRDVRLPEGLCVAFVVESEPLGTGGGMCLAYKQITADPFLALNGDTFCDANLAAMLAFHRERQAAITLALTRVPDSGRYGRVERAPDGRITRFVEKEAAGEQGLINCGLYLVSAAVMNQLPEGKALSWERDVLARRIGSGLYGVEAASRFVDIGTPESLSSAASVISPRGALP